MKTLSKALNKAVNAENLEDIIFENRNHEYGAYALRKNYTTRLNLSLLVVLSFASLIVLIIFISSISTPPEIIPLQTGGITVVVKPENIDEVLPPQIPDVKLPKSLTKATKFVVPVFVDDPTGSAQSDPNEIILPGTFVVDTIDWSKYKFIGSTDPPDSAIDNPNTIFYPTQVNEQATFRGKPVEDFRIWLAENLVYPEMASEYDIFGTVYVNFTVGKNDKLRNIVIQRSIHPLIDQAVVNAIKNSPDDWRAARIDGDPVNVSYTIPIKFDLQR